MKKRFFLGILGIIAIILSSVCVFAPGGGFVFTPVHNIQDDVSAENFWAMWDALQEYGKKWNGAIKMILYKFVCFVSIES